MLTVPDSGLYSPQWEMALPVVPQIQVTRNCNQSCDYCFQSHSGHIISLDTVEAILKAVIAHNQRVYPQNPLVQIYWHGGEPLLAGTEFFRNVVRLEQTYPGIVFENRLQTNGTLMDDEMAQFFVLNRFHIGFSLDGPRHIHNRHRHFSGSRRSAFDSTMRGIERFRRFAGHGRVAAIAVVTRAGIDQAPAVFSFFKDLEAEVQLDIFDLRCLDLNNQSDLLLPSNLAPSPGQIGWFLIDLFDLWFTDKARRVDFHELRQEVLVALQPQIDHGDPFNKKRCDFRRLIFAPNGLVFSCDQWLNDEQTALGDIRVDSLEKILERKARLWEEIKRRLRVSGEVMGCGQCEWGRQCGGGCLTCMKYNALLHQARANGLPDSRWFEGQLPARWNEIKGETYYCEGLRTFRRHVREAVQRELSNAEQ